MLTKQQIEQIENDVRKADIYYSHLSNDLIDHICCDIENLMEQGYIFHEAYKKVQQRIGYKGLKQIQNDTFYLIFKTYRKMKETMKISGFIAPALLGIGSIFKMMHWPGASVIILLGFITLCLLFLPTSVYVLYKETNNRKSVFLYISSLIAAFCLSTSVLLKIMHWPGTGDLTFVGIAIAIFVIIPAILKNEAQKEKNKLEKKGTSLAFIAIALVLIAYLFKIEHWPGAGVLLITSNILLFLIALPIYTFGIIKMTNHITGKLIYTIIGSAWLIITLNLISINNGVNFAQSYTDNYLMINDLIKQTEHYNHSKSQLCTDTITPQQLRTKTHNLVNHIEIIKNDLIDFANVNHPDKNNKNTQLRINNPFAPREAEKFMFSNNNADNINKAISEYLEFIGSLYTKAAENIHYIQFKNDLKDEQWAQYFSKTVLFSATYLAILQQKVLLIESDILSYEEKIVNNN